MKKSTTFLFLYLLSIQLQAQVSKFIHVDQFGYFTDAEKVAVLNDPQIGFNASDSYSPPAQLEVRAVANDQTVFTGPITSFNNGQTDAVSGDRGWWFDFSAVETDGNYYVFDPQNEERSAVFRISQNPYLEVLQTAGRMFFYNRCNFPKEAPYAEANWTDGQNFLNPLQDANCRYIYDPNNAALEKDLSGGWFDAGDYNKYVTFTEGALHDLLYAFEENPDAFGEDWNIPESGNSFPDLIDEIKWELDWLLKMTNPDGSTHNKMGSQNYAENVLSPPSVNNHQRFYGPTCTSASASLAGVFAHAAFVFKQIEGLEGYAADLGAKAKTAFNYVLPFYENGTLEVDCDDGSIVAGDADRDAAGQKESLVAASVYLFQLTDEDAFHQFFQTNYASTETMTSGYWGADRVVIQDALLRYTQLSNGVASIKNAISQSATIAVNNNWNGFFGWQLNDLYRSFMPDWSYYWGSNRPKAGYGSLNLTMANLGFANNAASLRRKSAEHLHYFHGVNPLGMVMLSNMYGKGGERCVNEIYHTWFNDGTVYDHALTSPKGPAPGFVTGGPNRYFGYTQLSPPANQPTLKSYLDFNDGWPESSWEISEPAIYYQAAYIRLLANYVVAGDPVNSVFENIAYAEEIQISPNPAAERIYLPFAEGDYLVKILEGNGRLVKTVELSNADSVDVQPLPSGVYFLEITEKRTHRRYWGKWVKR